ncbi:CRISPR-associated Cas3 family helicase [Humitalea rosea]|uniref:CRISPR-associated Cas3 family helicase n=2 Tax=Humitalea rosea TaxID=990373 RepID=A0A2W7IFC9_9PROT|nr:CRISPR-associated Cas3 family helicase [Humitalea rosea]
MHPLVAHALDVAAVAMLLPRSSHFTLAGQTLGFLTAVHDIGKFSRVFQGMAPAAWPAAALGPLPPNGVPSGPKHDVLGLQMLRTTLGSTLDDVLPPRIAGRYAWDDGSRGPLLRALAGHHGRPPADPLTTPGSSEICTGCLDAAVDFIDAMRRLFSPPALPRPGSDHDIARLGWQLAGVVTLADWIGSRQAWFPYVAPAAVADPAAYWWDHALPQAASALAAAGMASARPSRFTGMGRLFPAIQVPSPIQAWAETVTLPAGPVMAVIEDLTGSGKTEAAVILAHRLLAEGRATGLFLALPTMATANAMFGRLGQAYRGLFAAEAHPSLVLAHARATLDPRFINSIPAEAPPARNSPADPADEPAEAHCAAWLAEDRRRALLAQVGVGTLDQALLAVLPVRHAALRLQGLAGKVLVVDEVHAFDAYMRREILTLLEFHAALGGSVILLSATLPKHVRQQLVTAFRKGLQARALPLAQTAYPLATLVGADGVVEQPCDVRAGLARRVVVSRLPDAAAALERVLMAAKAGAAVAWVRNTVDDAIAAAAAVRAQGVTPLLFHARFAMADRLDIEAEVLRRFGRGSDGATRAGVLIATQVIEQSLDLDFDLLVTDLAPADLLIQRAGRLWRHARGARPISGPELLIISPEPVDEPAADWIKATQPGTAAVYRDPALLWRSARAVFGRGAITTPQDMRPLIETAFDTQAPGAIPAALADAAGQALGKAQAATGIARQNLLVFTECYDRNAGLWEPETQTPTRLEDRPQVTLRLALLRDGAVVPYAADADPARAWALSEVLVARHRIAACPVPAGLEAAVEAAKAGWGRWERESERVVLAVMTASRDAYMIEGRTESGTAVRIFYQESVGLSLCVPASAG